MTVSGEFRGHIWGILVAAYGEFSVAIDISGASYTPTLLSGLNWYQIASQVKSGRTVLGKAIIGVANYITGAICSITNDQPSSVCTSAPVKAAMSNLGFG